MHEGEALIEYADYYDYTSSYPEGERDDGDEEAELDAIDDDCFELVLPSGAKVGHRSLARYYKQSLNPGKNLSTFSLLLFAICLIKMLHLKHLGHLLKHTV